ncbi:MAG TPA: hypothetical protein VGS41_08610 [Chthonomonadales bacterium]|nr:hypothetical protein [Chthonomonadales bacterium]
MIIQEITALIVVGVAAAYLLRAGYQSWKSLASGKSGCGEGCSKCAFAAPSRRGGQALQRKAPSGFVPLSDLTASAHDPGSSRRAGRGP